MGRIRLVNPKKRVGIVVIRRYFKTWKKTKHKPNMLVYVCAWVYTCICKVYTSRETFKVRILAINTLEIFIEHLLCINRHWGEHKYRADLLSSESLSQFSLHAIFL